MNILYASCGKRVANLQKRELIRLFHLWWQLHHNLSTNHQYNNIKELNAEKMTFIISWEIAFDLTLLLSNYNKYRIELSIIHWFIFKGNAYIFYQPVKLKARKVSGQVLVTNFSPFVI